MKKKVLLLGAEGMFGVDGREIFSQSGFDVYPADLPQTDITNLDSLEKIFEKLYPNFVINAAAYTDVDGAEKEKDLAMKINRDGAFNVAKMCKKYGSFLVHISTDYIFDGGKKEGYVESDELFNPLNFYGETKLQGELKIKEVLPLEKFLICRTQWLYGRGRNNFVKTIVKVSSEKKEIEVISDQWGVPTWTKELAMQIVYLIRNGISGVAHTVGGGGPITWYHFAKDIVKILKRDCKIIPITSEELHRPAKRPRYGFLKNTLIPEGYIRNYKTSLKMFLKEENLI